ncbi:hypothetical protein WG899_02015 [Paucibacter sp. AS339]|uniref:hypothetical protein n=1 Tax=Paucibacter hankyongi TaxID=3133434 RepID=UPI0030B47E3E
MLDLNLFLFWSEWKTYVLYKTKNFIHTKQRLKKSISDCEKTFPIMRKNAAAQQQIYSRCETAISHRELRWLLTRSTAAGACSAGSIADDRGKRTALNRRYRLAPQRAKEPKGHSANKTLRKPEASIRGD